MVNIAEVIWQRGRQNPEAVAVWSPTRQLSFAELHEASSRVAATARRAGIRPLDRVVMVIPTVLEFPVLYYGLLAAGATVVTVNTMATVHEMTHIIEDAQPSLVVAWHTASTSARIAADTAGIPIWEVGPNAQFDDDAGPAQCWDFDPLDTAVILYTSGTTGTPKGAELTASNLVANAHAFGKVSGLAPSDRVGTALPLFHVYGQAVTMNSTLCAGGSLVLQEKFDPRSMLELVRDCGLTGLSAVPTMWIAMLGIAADFTAADFSQLRYGTSGGAPLPLDVLLAFKERFGCIMLEGYGLSETTGIATFNDIHKEQKPGTVGTAVPGTKIEIRQSGERLATGQVGEIYVWGSTVMKGYWNRPDATRSELVDGWLRTGDLGSLDSDGYLTIVGRAKELIVRGGYNVYPREVEEVLYEHPRVIEVAVIGVPDDYYGEEVGAVVVCGPGPAVDPQELRTWAKVRLAAYKVPHLFAFVDELPKASTGKILKRAIDPALLRASPTQ
ncbi:MULTISPECIES: AMP-binding protein [unclassified Mycolicibacterium]|uniref:AMP-binding protein n=1 Tax=unclassified Mycolicibacterium TaxID=2636767 RepID=UPI0012DC5ABF|nr:MULTISPECIES: AMP-binding protein [unclassified Mycolicibacterium]MUL84378.1 long-chain fatty acid--CoA ligase [Mycolicibacterium sp. CBMA 329]MUL88153.1 long-chain fatty acid--CoA ligase [Mycolicibacterium sp. CBMA 331]MUM02458.1 long-chain fatty acid--CoA ligase [Mycolicibacterium sp. CBMA 334]MUM26001.1 long-chain fatty acid--CoA ligase [Mycolicibacterium sp. CBMA 295]MUM39800.1 long-chain fatty acid--CoA ligase [Mycolicibacterium sp. CBMA 247]